MSEDNYKGLKISLKGHYRIINNEKHRLISEFVNDLREILHISHPLTTEKYLKKWEEKLK